MLSFKIQLTSSLFGDANTGTDGERASGSFILSREIISEKFPGVLVVVAIDAEVLPIGTIGRIVEMVSILVVHGQQLPVLGLKLPSTFRADESMNLERTFPVIAVRKGRLLQFSDHLVDALGGGLLPGFRISSIFRFFHHPSSFKKRAPLPC
jgi:hypothetical protein